MNIIDVHRKIFGGNRNIIHLNTTSRPLSINLTIYGKESTDEMIYSYNGHIPCTGYEEIVVAHIHDMYTCIPLFHCN